MYNSDNIVTECLFSNIFIINNEGVVLTPPDDLVLLGTMRAGVIETCERMHIPVKQEAFTKDFLLSDKASEVMICNSLITLVSIKQVDDASKQQKLGSKI